MYYPTSQEITAYTHMQARLIALLLRHDSERFQRAITTHPDYDAPPEDAALHHYRELGVLFWLRDELFEHILPRIVRRLSFVSPRATVIEEPPTRGRVDWERTLNATWGERPGEPPFALHTHQRHRDFATPENLLTVATLLDYRADVLHVLQHEHLLTGSSVLRHPLTTIVERCERELAFPQFATLRQHIQSTRGQADIDTASLEERVRERVIPGGNSAYEDLLAWREQRRTLSLLQRTPQPDTPATLGADPRRDNYLYQIWIFYELVDLLHQAGQLETIEAIAGKMRLTFHQGDGASRCRYELRHDQAVPTPVVQWAALPAGGDVPGVRPDFLLRRIDPPPQQVTHGGQCFWREPGIIWDAKYYRERESQRTPSTPLKRMLADLTLLGESRGVLLFAFLTDPTDPAGPSEPTDPADDDPTAERAKPVCRVLSPAAGQDQTLVPNQRIESHRLQPDGGGGGEAVANLLRGLLDDGHEHLHRPRVPHCHGVFLDSLSAAGPPGGTENRYGEPLDTAPDDLLICPKPHIGAWRVDLVSRTMHCCKDARLCHIIAHPDRRLPVRPPRTAEDLLKELQHIVEQGNAGQKLDDETVRAIAQQVEHLTRQFAEIAGAYRRIEMYQHRVRDLGMHRTWEMLGPPEQESLALAVFLVEQLDSIAAQDFSAPAIHVSSVLEVENQKRVFRCPDLIGDGTNPKRQTLGTLPFWRLAHRNNMKATEEAQANWLHIVDYAGVHWQEEIAPDEPAVSFDDYVKLLDSIAQIRNQAAHTSALPRADYVKLFEQVCQRGRRMPFGVLNTLLLAWRG